MAAFLRVCFFYFIASAASQERDDTDRRLLAARCYAHCLTYDPLATNVSERRSDVDVSFVARVCTFETSTYVESDSIPSVQSWRFGLQSVW